jgi:ADP-ribose pyrophosphatase
MEIPKTIRSDCAFAGRVVDVVVDEIEFANGTRAMREVIRHRGSAVVVPVLPDGSIVLVQQYRHPFRTTVTELPAGKLEQDEDPALCAARELSEETGFVAQHLEHLTSIYPTPGFCNEIIHLFLATELSATGNGQTLDEGEHGLTYAVVPMDEALAMIDRGDIKDAKSICGILLASRRLQRK